MATKESTLTLMLKPAAFQAGLRATVDATSAAGRAMGRALKEPINAGLKSARGEIKNMFSDLGQGLKTIGTLGGALAIGTFVKDAVNLRKVYGDMASQINLVQGNTTSWQAVQEMVEGAVVRTGQKAEVLTAAFTEAFRETGEMETAARMMNAVGTATTATGHAANELATATQIAMTKWGIKTPEEALARVLEGTGAGGKQLNQMSGSFEMLGEAAAQAGHTGGNSMTLMMNLITQFGDKAEPGLAMMMQTMKQGSSQVLKLQKAIGSKVKFTADMSALDHIRATFLNPKGRAAAEKIFRGDARIVYDNLAKPFDAAYADAKAAGLSDADALKKGLQEFDSFLEEASTSTKDFGDVQKVAADRMKDDPGMKLEMAIEKIRLKFASPEVLGMIDKLADKLPLFADTVVKVMDMIIANPWESLAVVVGGKLALAFGGSLITEAITAGMKGLFARMAAVQAGSAAMTGAASKLGVGGAISAGAATTGAGGAAATAATVGAAVVGAGLVGAAAGYGAYKHFGLEKRQEKEFDAMNDAQLALMDTRHADTKPEIEAAMQRLEKAKTNLNQGSWLNSMVGVVARPFMDVGDPQDKVKGDIEREQRKLKEALRLLAEGSEKVGKAMKNAANTTRGPMRPADSNPGAKPTSM